MGRTADAIAEGVAIATAAARLAVKNHILIGTIAEDGVFDMDKYIDDAREALRAMAEESEEAAATVTALRKRARGRHSDPVGTHDYRDRDVRNLRRRAKQSTGVAVRLREIMQDRERLAEIVEEARGRRLGRRAPQPRPSPARRRHASRSGSRLQPHARSAYAGASARRSAGALVGAESQGQAAEEAAEGGLGRRVRPRFAFPSRLL